MALHTDYYVRWKNFRAFPDTDWIVIKPLTILIGPNNAGKTSMTAPLLLMAQTSSSEDISSPLVTRGGLFDAGNYADLIHSRNKGKDLFLGFRYHVHPPGKRKISKVGTYPPGAAELTFAWDRKNNGIILKQCRVFDFYARLMLEQRRLSNGQYRLKGRNLEGMTLAERFAISSARLTNFFFSVAATMSAYDRRVRGEDAKRKQRRHTHAFQEYLSIIGFMMSEMRGVLAALSYIGPIRERPRRYYEVKNEGPLSVGPRGENAPDLLRRRFNSIRSGINRWVRAFEFGDRLLLEDLSDSLFTLCFARSKRAQTISIADAGFGASQVLPLVVQALTGSRGSLTIAEQPEIHLNPRLQCVLGDLLCEMANADQRVVVETHSEHLLLTVRRLVAEKKITSDKVAIYYIEGAGGKASIRSIPLTSNGGVPEKHWPKGFFEDGLREALALASAQTARKS